MRISMLALGALNLIFHRAGARNLFSCDITVLVSLLNEIKEYFFGPWQMKVIQHKTPNYILRV